MCRCGLWGAALACALTVCGCQSAGDSAPGMARAPSFGVDHIPRQSEPEIDEADTGRRVVTASAETSEDFDEVDEAGQAPGGDNLLARLLPGREKRAPRRQPLPVSERTEAEDDDTEY